jgi:VCBS repeat-containing protein
VSASGDEETAITGSLPATDPDTGDTLTYSIEDGDEPTNGTAGVDAATGSWSYSGNLNFAGSDSFTITVTDGDDLTDAVVVDLTVANVNDDPVATSGSVSATDADGDSVTFSLGTPAAKGTADVNADGTFTYLPTAGQTGADSFTVTASDGHGGTDTATVMVDILGQGPVIDVANSDVTPVMDPLFIATGHIAASDPDDDPLTYSIDGNPAGITIDGSGNYVYDGTVAGPNFFTVRVSDGTHDATQMVIVSSSPL